MIYSTLYDDLLFAYTFTLLTSDEEIILHFWPFKKPLSLPVSIRLPVRHSVCKLYLVVYKHASWYTLSVCINKGGH